MTAYHVLLGNDTDLDAVLVRVDAECCALP